MKCLNTSLNMDSLCCSTDIIPKRGKGIRNIIYKYYNLPKKRKAKSELYDLILEKPKTKNQIYDLILGIDDSTAKTTLPHHPKIYLNICNSWINGQISGSGLVKYTISILNNGIIGKAMHDACCKYSIGIIGGKCIGNTPSCEIVRCEIYYI